MAFVACSRGARRGASRRLLSCCVAVALTAACSPAPSLQGTLESDEAVAQAVLAAVEANDRAALMALSVSKDEFEDLVWPTLPASRPEVGMPVSYVWQDTVTKSRAGLAQTLERYGGRRFELVRVETGGDTTDHGSFTISRKTYLVAKDEEGHERTLRLFGSMIRGQDGRSKVYSYIVD